MSEISGLEALLVARNQIKTRLNSAPYNLNIPNNARLSQYPAYINGTTPSSPITYTELAAGAQGIKQDRDNLITALNNKYGAGIPANTRLDGVLPYINTVYYLTTNVSPSGSGDINKSPNKSWFYPGTTVQLTAVPTSGYVFTEWEDGSTINPRTITMNSDKTVTASFVSQYTPVESVTILGASSPLYVGNERILSARVLPNNVEDTTVTWSISDESKISITSRTGYALGFTCTSIGLITITATSNQDPTKSDTVEILIMDPIVPPEN